MSPRGSSAIRGAIVAFAAAALAACGGNGGASVSCDDAPCCGPRCGETPPVELGDLGRFTHLAPLSDGRLAIATYDATKKNMIVIVERPDGTERTVHVVDGWRPSTDALGDRLVDVDAGRWATLAVGADDAIHVAWFDADEGELHYARGDADAGFASVEVVDGDGPATRGTHASLALDDAGLPHIAYRDETRKNLRYARRDARGAWQTRAIDGCAGEPGCPVAGSEDFGEWAALAFVPAVGGGVAPRIAFYDRFRGDLKMAAQAGDGSWVTSTLDGRDPVTFADQGDVGRFASVASTPTRQLGIAYFDVTRGTLRYLSPGAGPRTVDDGRRLTRAGAARRDAVGQFVRLAYDDTGRAHFVYADGSVPGLRHAVVVGEAAANVTALDVPAGGWIDFVVGDDGGLVGAYGAFLPDAAPRTRLQLFTVAP
ncbi:MAG: hypothetical protein U1F43_23370 [Myxococcota bacterium]